MRLGLLFAGAAALALAACGDAENNEAATPPAADPIAGDQPLTPDAANDPAMPSTAQDFTSMVAASDMYEIEAGKLAQQIGKAQRVKDFGAMMVEEHTKSSADLKAAAGKAEGVTVKPELTTVQQSNLDALRNAKDDFDATYARQQVAAHQKTLAVLQSFGANGDSEPLKAFANTTAKVVEGHLEKARQLP